MATTFAAWWQNHKIILMVKIFASSLVTVIKVVATEWVQEFTPICHSKAPKGLLCPMIMSKPQSAPSNYAGQLLRLIFETKNDLFGSACQCRHTEHNLALLAEKQQLGLPILLASSRRYLKRTISFLHFPPIAELKL